MVSGALSTTGVTALVVKVFHKQHPKGDSQPDLQNDLLQRSDDHANSND
jgi:hypothetical protein